MIKISEAAATQMRASAQDGGMDGMALRVAATRNEDGSFHSAMGFDEARDDDSRFQSEGIDLLVAPSSLELLDGMVIDYVELDGGNREFIFMNPNDPGYVPPTD